MPIRETKTIQKLWLLTPLFGISIFACLYIIATFFYPGGSEFDGNSVGFSWAHNYWCNLLSEKAINGQHNRAKELAIIAMIILCFSLAQFWYIFPTYAHLPKHLRRTIHLSGVLSIATNAALFTGYHDAALMIATGFGLIALAGTLIRLKKLKWTLLFWAGLFNIALVVLNNILYYGNDLRYYLPVVQKITFLYVLFWIGWINLRLFKAVTAKRLLQVIS